MCVYMDGWMDGWMDADRCDPGVSSLCLSVCLSVCSNASRAKPPYSEFMIMIELNPRLAGIVCSLFYFLSLKSPCRDPNNETTFVVVPMSFAQLKPRGEAIGCSLPNDPKRTKMFMPQGNGFCSRG